MKVIIRDKSAAVFFENTFYDTNKEIDLTFSQATRMGRLVPIECFYEPGKYDPKLWKNKKFNLTSDIDSTSGWGNVSTNLIKFSKGYEISLVGKVLGTVDSSISQAKSREVLENGAMVWHEQPKANWIESPFHKNVAIVPWETTQVPQSWIKNINAFDGLLVPCQQNVEVFKYSGVRIPIEVVHWGIDSKLYYPLERHTKVFTFGTMGALSTRKGTDLLIAAFKKAFWKNEDVRLICKTSYNNYPFMVNDDRIKVMMMAVSYDELVKDFFSEVDCFVFPTRGEGFGLPPLEAMATGIPVIGTGWSGLKEFLNSDNGWVLDYKMVPATAFTRDVYKTECGEWAEPSLDDLISKMVYAYEHQDEVKKKGIVAANNVKNNWLWEKKIKMFHGALNKFL